MPWIQRAMLPRSKRLPSRRKETATTGGPAGSHLSVPYTMETQTWRVVGVSIRLKTGSLILKTQLHRVLQCACVSVCVSPSSRLSFFEPPLLLIRETWIKITCLVDLTG